MPSSNKQCINFKGDQCASPSRQVSYNKQRSEPADVAVNQTIQPTKEQQHNIKHINSKGDHCASPSRQVFQHDNSVGEPVDETMIKQIEHGSHFKTKAKHSNENNKQKPGTPQAQYPPTQDGNKRCTKAERAKWQVANGLSKRKSRAE